MENGIKSIVDWRGLLEGVEISFHLTTQLLLQDSGMAIASGTFSSWHVLFVRSHPRCRQYELYTGAGPSSSSSWSWSSFIVVKTDVSLKVCQEPKQRAVCGARNQHHPAGNDSRSMEYGMRCTAEIMRQTRKSKGTTYSDLFPGKWEDTNSNIF